MNRPSTSYEKNYANDVSSDEHLDSFDDNSNDEWQPFDFPKYDSDSSSTLKLIQFNDVFKVVNESEEDEETEIKSIIIEIIDEIENENDCTEKETTQTHNKKLYRWRKGDKTKWKKSIVAEKKKLSKTPRIIDCSNCKFKCSLNFNEDNIKYIFWTLDYNKQKDYILSSVSQAVVKRHVPTTKVRKPKEASKVYSLNLNSTSEQVCVCKQFYLKTLAISYGPVDKAFEGFDSVSGFFSNTDKRG